MAELIADREQGPAPAQPIFKARRGGGGDTEEIGRLREALTCLQTPTRLQID